MADFSFLLGAKPVDIPNPLTFMTQGASLADLMTGVQAKQLALQQQQGMIAALQNPDILQNLLGPGASGLTPEQLQTIGPGILPLMSSVLGIRKTQAETNASNAVATANLQKAHDAQLVDVGNTSDLLAQNPTSGLFNSLITKINQYRLGQEIPPPPDPTQSTAADIQNWARQITATTAASRSQIAEQGAGALQKRAEAFAIPQRTDIAQKQLAIEQAKFYGGEAHQDPTTGTWVVTRPGRDAQGNPTQQVVWAGTAATATPAAGPAPTQPPGQGIVNLKGPMSSSDLRAVASEIESDQSTVGPPAPTANMPTVPTTPQGAPKTGANKFEQALQESGAKEIGNLAAKAQAATITKSLVNDLRSTDAEGMFSGGIAGTPFFQKLANVFSPFLPADAYQQLANTQAWTANTGNLIAQAVSQFVGSGGRVAAREIDFFRGIKPEALQTPEGRQQIYQNVWNMADRIQQQSEQAPPYVEKTKDYSLSGYQPKLVDRPMPPVQLNSLPNPRTWSDTSKGLQMPDGSVARVDPVRRIWVDAKTGAPITQGQPAPPTTFGSPMANAIPQ